MTNHHLETVRLFNEWLDAELRKGARRDPAIQGCTTSTYPNGRGGTCHPKGVVPPTSANDNEEA